MKSLAVAGVFCSRAGKVLQLVTAAASGSLPLFEARS
jgi:hypothetical protein